MNATSHVTLIVDAHADWFSYTRWRWLAPLRGVHTAYDVVCAHCAATYDVVTPYDVIHVVRPPYHVRGRTMYYVCRLMHTNKKWRLRMTLTMSFWLLVVIFTRLANFLVIEIDKLDLNASGFTTRCVVEMTWVNMTDSYKNFCWTVTLTGSTDTFGCQQSS